MSALSRPGKTYRAPLPLPLPEKRRRYVRHLRVGLLGGSFNPAHEGHLHISLEALKRLALDQVWWLVSPRNPLKDEKELAALPLRLARARQVARHPRIRVLDLEARLATRYTADTLIRLRRAHPEIRFVWLMGADNLAQFPRWRQWRRILRLVPVAVFERRPYSYGALAGPVAKGFADVRLHEERAVRLADLEPPQWVFVRMRSHPASATAIRRAGGWPPGAE